MTPPPALILNVDDSEAGRYTKSRILQSAGYMVIDAATGADALALTRERLPDLVLLDVRLPDLNGIEVCRQIKSDPALEGTMVLQTSAQLTGSADRIRGLDGGADNYLAAPIVADELIASVSALLRLRRTQQELSDKVARVQASERRQAFQLRLAERLHDLTSPEEIIAAACALLGQELDVSRVVYGEVSDDGLTVHMRREWTAPGIVSVAGKTKVMKDFGPEMIDALFAGEVIINNDVALDSRTAKFADAYKQIGVQSELLIPFVRAGKLRLVTAFHRASPYRWKPHDIQSGEDMAERTWAAVEAACAQAALRIERDQSQSVLNSMAEGFALLSHDWTVLRVNEEGVRLTQRKRDEIVGRNHWDVFPELINTGTDKLYRRVRETGIPGTVEEVYSGPLGVMMWLEIRAYPFPNNGLAVFFRDISERKEGEHRLREADRRKDEFLAMLAHELRNPLAPISAAAEILKSGQLDQARTRQTSEIIGRQVKHMTELVDDLLDVSRVTRGLAELKKTALDIRKIVSDAVEQVSPLIHMRGHHLMLHVLPEMAVVIGDKKRLVQVLANLLTNAAKYTHNGGNIVLATQLQPDWVRLTVEDNGIGMVPELADRVFELFTQAERTSDRTSGGLGIGLALVKSIVELHGGTVSCTSEGLGKGSRFTVCLPRVAEPSPRVDRRQTPRNAAGSSQALKIMVVDDNTDAAEMLAMLLEAAGHQVWVEHSAARALELAKLESPDVCLLDIGLPDMDGHELAKRLRAQPETTTTMLIAVTGYGQEQDRKNSLAAGFDHHLVKPVDTARLSTVIAAFAPAKNRHGT